MNISMLARRSAVLLLVLSAMPFPLVFADDTIFGGLTMPAPGYAKTLREKFVERTEVDGLSVVVHAVPDLFVYELALAFEECSRAGYKGEKLEKELVKVYAKAKRDKDKALLLVELVDDDSQCHYFLTRKIDQHIGVSGGARKVGRIDDVQPQPRYLGWTIFVGAGRKSWKLAHIEEMRFACTIKKKKGGKPIEVELHDLVRYRDIEKKSEYETKGINYDTKQISLGNIADLQLPKGQLKLYPGKWKLPKAPKHFDALVEHLESGK